MELVRFDKSHIKSFLQRAALEEWVTASSEIEFLLSNCPSGCLVCLHKGVTAGFITSIIYQRSAWIGNLLVMPEFRGQGIGRNLMETVLRMLDESTCETIWLTASADGEQLYKKLGFRHIDVVRRWKGGSWLLPSVGSAVYCENVRRADFAGWGDNRPQIFAAQRDRFSCFTTEKGFIASSITNGMQHIGPFGAASESAAAELFGRFRALGTEECDAILDVPAKNSSATKLLVSSGFTTIGVTQLMYRGTTPEYHPDKIFALASLGSYG